MKQADNSARKPKARAENFLQRSTKSFQDNVADAAPMAAASYTLIGSIILLGLIGYAVDRWLGTSPWFLVTGLLLAIIVGFYELAKVAFKSSGPDAKNR
jgi:F0F1-type ATP synthase assembly protein I